jgi:hypothetical protein
MLKELYQRVRVWFFPEPEQPIETDEDHSSLATLVRLLQDSDPASGHPS